MHTNTTLVDEFNGYGEQLSELGNRIAREINYAGFITNKKPRVMVTFTDPRVTEDGSYVLDFTIKKDRYESLLRSYIGHTLNGFVIVHTEACGGWQESLLEVVPLDLDTALRLAGVVAGNGVGVTG